MRSTPVRCHSPVPPDSSSDVFQAAHLRRIADPRNVGREKWGIRFILSGCVAMGLGGVSLVGSAQAAPPVATAVRPSATVSASATVAAESVDLDLLATELASPLAMSRRLAAHTLAAAPAEAEPTLTARLIRPTTANPAIQVLMEKARKTVTAATGTTEADDQLIEALVDAGNSPSHVALVVTLAGIRALEKHETLVAARTLVRVAVEHRGLYRVPATHALKRMGDPAVAALIEVRRDETREMKLFAAKTLDTFGKFLPSDAVQASSPQGLAIILAAYGKVHDPDALNVVVTHLNAERAPVRDSARWAIAQYADAAKPVLKEAYDTFTGEKSPDDWDAARLLRGLVAAYDKVRLAEVSKLLDEGIAHRDAGRLEEAVSSFDALLARVPTFERRAELAPAYFELAKKKADPAQSRVLLAKAQRLAEGTPLAPAIKAEVLFREVNERAQRGVYDVVSLREVLTLDPKHPGARDLLSRFESDGLQQRQWIVRMAYAVGAGLATLILATLFLGRRRSQPMLRRA